MLAVAVTAGAASAPIVDGRALLAGGDLVGRIRALEQQNTHTQALLELKSQIDAQGEQVQMLQDRLERLDKQLKDSRRTQQSMYEDLRLQRDSVVNQPPKKAPAGKVQPATDNTADLASPVRSQAYQLAISYIDRGMYEQAISEFQRFISRYSRGALADNAVYWLAEAQYALGRYASALSGFERLLRQFPKSQKVPGALLKIGYSYYELQDSDHAQQVLQDLRRRFPTSPEAQLAEKRLNLIGQQSAPAHSG